MKLKGLLLPGHSYGNERNLWNYLKELEERNHEYIALFNI